MKRTKWLALFIALAIILSGIVVFGAQELGNLTLSDGTPLPETVETVETDVLVIGGGGAGLAAALTAAAEGSNVILLEKMSYLGGATLMSGGIIPAANTKQQEDAGITDTEELFARDILRPSGYSVRKDLVYTVTAEAKSVIEWLEEQGVVFNLITSSLYYGQSNYRMHLAEGSGQEMTRVLVENASNHEKIDVRLNTPATDLVVNNGTVVGAVAETENGLTLYKANNTVLATSGFAANKDWLEKYMPEILDAVPMVAPGATGEGILWGKNLGADIANMKAYQGHGLHSTVLGKSLSLGYLYAGGMLVNANGDRFTNEHIGYSELTPEVLQQPGGKVHLIFDQAVADANESSFATLKEKDALTEAADLETLGAALGLDSERFALAIEDFKNGMEKGEDSLNRTLFPASLTGPFYAVEITADLRHTQGGLVTDLVGHVVKPDHTLIPGLYAAGGVMEGFSDTAGPGYMSGNGLLQAFVFGRLAGKAAATTDPASALYIGNEYTIAYKDIGMTADNLPQVESTVEASEQATETEPTDSPETETEPQPTEAADATYVDGVYEGEGIGHDADEPIRVQVKIEDGKITEIEVLSHNETAGIYESAESGIIEAVLAANSADVDVVSGATESSDGLLEAIRKALADAK
ncbi:MAG TPA: FAD-dependent oxidoreductase [Fastidiosipila sp.]|nr:FAD-dependent oxidoreductase [Fastidiosipila sp.]